MRIQFERNNFTSPQVSIILLDWSCRESFHILHYLSNQTIPREKYEVIWIEYYDRKVREIEKSLAECHRPNSLPLLDKWITMDMPHQIYYHKHLMYNIGIIASSGTILTVCDSDAVVNPTFLESIIRFFEKENDVVLHMDQVRSVETRFYPFNYPTIEEIKRSECANLIDGKPRGLVDRSFPLHTPNYGACFSALRKDVIHIGGADEHIDYLGHICGPYDMTFRLINTNKKEIWHPEEWLYHVWHPGQSGDNNYAGPHDGKHMSQTALSIRRTGRVFPLVENRAIEALRIEKDKNISKSGLFELALSGAEIENWRIDRSQYSKANYWVGDTKINMREKESSAQQGMKNLIKNPLTLLKFIKFFIIIFVKELCDKVPLIQQFLFRRDITSLEKSHEEIAPIEQKLKSFKHLLRTGLRFFKRLILNESYVIGRCMQCLNDLNSIGVSEVVLFGDRWISEIIAILSDEYSINVKSAYHNIEDKVNTDTIHDLEIIKEYAGKIIIASFDNVENKTSMLFKAGIKRNMIVDLW